MNSIYDLLTEDYDAMTVYLMVYQNKFFEDMEEEEKDICADAIYEATAKERREALASAKPVVAAKEKVDEADKKYKHAKGELKKSFRLQAGNATFQSEEERNFRHKYDDEKEDIVDDPFVKHKARAAKEKEETREEYWQKKKHAKEVMKTAKKMVREKQNKQLKRIHGSNPQPLHTDKPVYEYAVNEDVNSEKELLQFHQMFDESKDVVSRAIDNFMLTLESGDAPDKEELLTCCGLVKKSDLYTEAANESYSIVPEKSVGKVKFGANKVQVEALIKGKEGVDADYDSSGNCICVSLSDNTNVSISGIRLMPGTRNQVIAALQQKDKDLKVSEYGCTSAKLSIQVSFSGGKTGKVTKVSAGKKGYYE